MQLENPRQQRARAALNLDHLSKTDRLKLADHLVRFERAWQAQQRHDTDVVAGLVRTLRNPRGVQRVEVDALKQFILQIIEEKDARSGSIGPDDREAN